VSRTKEIEHAKDKIKTLKDAKREKGDSAARKIKIFDYVETPLESKDIYGRIAAQTAKQVIMQRIREAEREVIFGEFKSKEGEVVSGVIQRIERGNIFVDIGKTTGIMFFGEQIPYERYRIGQRLRALVVKVERDAKGSLVVLSRSHPKMIIKLFEFEVPEIESGAVEIKAVAREAGSRSKVAVVSNADGVDPVGSCVGQKGTRVATIINELGGEKIDIIEWNESPEKFIANALAPAKIVNVKISEAKREARVEVDEDQLSLAIGKNGQNVRLAAKLTGWRIDIVSGEKKLTIEEAEEGKEVEEGSEKEKVAGDDNEKKMKKSEEKADEAAKEGEKEYDVKKEKKEKKSKGKKKDDNIKEENKK
jgi:transcription termination/antitermination protein NusA